MWCMQEEFKRMDGLRLQALEQEKRELGCSVGSQHEHGLLARDDTSLSILSFVCPVLGWSPNPAKIFL